ncbi:MAG: protease-associated PA domain-containing protein, partial [Actinomyces sp.]
MAAVLGVFVTLTAAVSSAGAAPPTPSPDDAPRTVAESPTGSYIVVLDGEGLAARLGTDALDTPSAERLADELAAGHDAVLADAGASPADKVQDYVNALDGFSAALSHDEAIRVANQPGVKMVIPDELHQITTDASPKFLGLTGKKGAWATGVTGEDVVVGVIDTGIWPEHPSFADTEIRCIDAKGKEKKAKDDGSCPKKTTPTEVQVYGPPPVTLDGSERPTCEFGNTAHNPDDAPFTCNNKLIGARQMLDTYRFFIGADPDEFDSARDDNGHGTHTASTAAGNAGVHASILGVDYGEISGIAPRARIIAYKALGNLGGFTSDLVSAIDQAVADGVDVINYSVGGGASLASPDAIAFLFAADAGVLVATSAGNSGPGPETIGGPADVPWVTSVGASTQKRFFEGQAELGDGTEVSGASITPMPDGQFSLVDAADAGGDLCIPGTL